MEKEQQPPGTALERGILMIFAHRMSLWLWLSVALLVAIFFLARHQIGVVVLKLALMTVGGYLGYVLSLALEGALRGDDRAMRPHEYRAAGEKLRAEVEGQVWADPARAAAFARAWELDQLAAAMLWRRSMVVSAALLMLALGG
jgi:hypothetical protein